MNDSFDRETVIPRVLARCRAAGIAAVPSGPNKDNRERRSYVIACMRGEDFEFGILPGRLTACDDDYDYDEVLCYRRAR